MSLYQSSAFHVAADEATIHALHVAFGTAADQESNFVCVEPKAVRAHDSSRRYCGLVVDNVTLWIDDGAYLSAYEGKPNVLLALAEDVLPPPAVVRAKLGRKRVERERGKVRVYVYGPKPKRSWWQRLLGREPAARTSKRVL